jgi:SAM-dependent methyltransferase
MSTRQYPLGTGRDELERLHLQHRLWSDAAHSAWKKAGIGPGARVLDVGCGPGAASFDLAELTTSSGRVVSIDESPAFIESLRSQAEARGLTQIDARVGDVQKLDLGERFDAAYARWVLCFTPRPEEVIRGVAEHLEPGGTFCVHDYFNYEAMTTAPRRRSYARIVEAGAKSWRDNGGDPDVVGRLPRMLREAGLELVHLEVHQRIARPGDTMFHWATSWWRTYAPKLQKMGYVDELEVEELLRDLDAMTREDDFLVLPPVFEVISRRATR